MLAKTYRIETERLVVRCYHPRDGKLLKNAIDESLEHLRPWMPWAKHEPESVETKIGRLRKYRGQFDLGHDYVFGIFSKDEKTQIGSTGLHNRLDDDGAREIGYWISAKYARQGYATEAVKALIKVAFEIEQIDRIEIHCSPDNIASQSIPEKLGFLHEATLKNRTTDTEGKPRDVMIWTLFKDSYQPEDLAGFKAFDVAEKEIK